jgi:hypothetical protein
LIRVPPLDLNQNIFNTSTQETKKWRDIEGHYLAETHTVIKRGFEGGLDIVGDVGTRMNIILKDWANLDFFIKAQVEASAKVQLETPLNFFEDIGLIAKLQVIAKAAIAIGLSVEVTVGEVISRATQNPDIKGLPETLLRTIMEELKLEGVLYGQAAVAVMAYMNMIIKGSFFPSGTQSSPGFEMIFDAGYGWIFGGGFRGYVKVGLENPRRMVLRMSDVLVTELVKDIIKRTGGNPLEWGGTHSNWWNLEGFLKMAVRISYDAGLRLASSKTNTIDFSPQMGEIILQEGQRWLLRQFARLGGNQILSVLQKMHPEMNITIERGLIENIPSDSHKIEEYLTELMNRLSQFPMSASEALNAEWLRGIVILWASLTIFEDMSKNLEDGSLAWIEFKGPIRTRIPEIVESILRFLDIEGPIRI